MLSGDLAVLNPKEGSAFQNVPVWAKVNVKSNGAGSFVITDPDGNVTTVAGAAALTQSLTMLTLPANAYVHAYRIKSVTSFVGTTTLTTQGIGVTGTLDFFDDTTLYDLMAAPSATNFLNATLAGVDNAPQGGNTTVASIALIVGLVATVTNLSTTTAGEFNFWVLYSLLP